ncbi:MULTISPECIES: hypothetical protein [Paenibacillus]|uniref:hypothetical protein n=1 Tax=Paenibacillus sp. ALJ109b TaxID=2709068 RepID=UPI0013D83B46|nr:hypothetical protein [Paenibacillus sp. ALJ109b]NEU64417.1 hypothetical protein [Paenibacillus sp. ALJ109b]
MTRKKRNQWRKWQASAAATLTVAALFQYVRTSDAFDVAYAAANGTDISNTASTQIDAQDDVMDEWTNNTDSNSDASSNEGYSLDEGTTDGSTAIGSNQGRSSGSWITDQNSNQDTDSGYSRGNYQSRTGAS